MDQEKSLLNKINNENEINSTISLDEEAGAPVLALQLAEELILQLASSNAGRNQWLKKYGKSAEASELRSRVDNT